MLKTRLILVPLVVFSLTACQKESLNTDSTTVSAKAIKKDITPPTISIKSPADQSAVWDTDILIQAADNLGLSKIELFEDGNVLVTVPMNGQGRVTTSLNYTVHYTPGLFDIRTLNAVATDLAGNTSNHQITVYKLVCGDCH